MVDPDDEYNVGYGSPPKHGQFPKGQSGNPHGRPSGRKNRKTILTNILQETVIYLDDGKRYEATKLDLLLKAIRLSTASGDTIAMNLYDKLMGLEQAEEVLTSPGILITGRSLSVQEWLDKYGSAEGAKPIEGSK